MLRLMVKAPDQDPVEWVRLVSGVLEPIGSAEEGLIRLARFENGHPDCLAWLEPA